MPIEALYVMGIIVIAGGMAWGLLRSRNRNRANDPIRDEATRQLYDNPGQYEAGGKQQLQDKLKPES